MQVGIRGTPGNRICETGHALATIIKNPAPEVGAFGRSAQDAPGAAEKREVQQKDRICRTQPYLHGIIRAEITIQHPRFFPDETFLQLDPLNTGSREQAGAPKDLVEFHDRQARDLTQLPRESRFPGRSATEYDHPLHKEIISSGYTSIFENRHVPAVTNTAPRRLGAKVIPPPPTSTSTRRLHVLASAKRGG